MDPHSVELTPGRIALGFGLTIGAGAATILATAFACCVKLNDYRILSCALGASSGVMLYVSFAELLSEARAEIELSGKGTASGLYTVLFFFSGIFAGAILELLAHRLSGDHSHHHGPEPEQKDRSNFISQDEIMLEQRKVDQDLVQSEENALRASNASEDMVIEQNPAPLDEKKEQNPEDLSAAHKKRLQKAAVFTALAVGLHNFPEGMATFISTVANPSLGVSVAFAIALHNIPEGVSICVPAYFSTGNLKKSILWTFLSALAEPLGALIGYGIVNASLDPFLFGFMFSFVAGMMVFVSVRELFPSAHRYDVDDKYVTWSFFVGIFIIAVSIELFAL